MLSADASLALVWWSPPDQEVFPWAPNLREQDRANVMLFSLRNPAKPQPLGYLRTSAHPISFRFLSGDERECFSEEALSVSRSHCALHFVGQSQGQNHVLESTLIYPVKGDKQLRRKNLQKRALPAQVTCCAQIDKLWGLGCEDGRFCA